MKLIFTETLPLEELDSLVQKLKQQCPQGGIFGLSGELGSGKTTLVRSVIKDIASRQKIKIDRVISPSFVLHQSYEILNPPVHHFDLYRLDNVTEMMLIELEYYEIVEKVRASQGFLFLEWPEMSVDKSILKLTAEIKITITGSSREYRLFLKD